jgi:hypothetical protein
VATGTRQSKIAEAEFKKLEKAGIIRRSNSAWASPLHMVPKKDGSWRPCGDYCRRNTITTPVRYPLPNIQDLANGLHSCTVFSKIDLIKGYHQVPIAPLDIIPFGQFEYLFMGFGLRNAAQTFQRTIDLKCRDLKFIFNYLDDSRIGSKTAAEHLDQFFAVLAADGLTINLSKGTFMVPELEVLGHTTPNTYRYTPSGREAAAVLLRDGQLLPPFHARFCSSPGATHESPPPSKEVKRHSSGYSPWTAHSGATNRYSLRQCRWHIPHPMPPSHWPQTHPTPTSHQQCTPTTGTRLLATVRLLFSHATTCRMEILDV